ncbi:hypothetical protein AB0L42_39550 [Streptomyces sp. NPDC052287]|uniref:hypothetical protein n=1 Tax=Streptomyces sp. NPDC052287 TaxID=3154950 RepID=UPI003444ACC2
MRSENNLPATDGPLVELALPDTQTLYAVVRSRQQEHDRTWAYQLEITLPSLAQVRGTTVEFPETVTFWVPASSCTPIDGQDYAEVPRKGTPQSPSLVRRSPGRP